MTLAGLIACTYLGACASEPPVRKQAAETVPIVRDIPEVLRSTLAGQATLAGTEPLLVSGLGVVVGLNGTGGGPYPEPIQATMERELARGGVGKGGAISNSILGDITPRELLASSDVAVVIIEGVINAGMPEGSDFDIQVRAIPGSGTTSLEGGSLWSTDLRLGPISPFGAVRAKNVAEASGSVFINPFADPASASGFGASSSTLVTSGPGAPSPGSSSLVGDGVVRTVGRVINGGRIKVPTALNVNVDQPSHFRVSSYAAIINTRFPQGPKDRTPTALGRSDSRLEVRVPHAWHKRVDEFLNILARIRVDAIPPERAAKLYADELQRSPALASDLSWCFVALGQSALPFVAPLYDAGELLPKMAALRAGALLDDPRAIEPLVDIALARNAGLGASPSVRAQAVELLGRMRPDPRASIALRTLLDAPELDIRTSGYQALVDRGDPSVRRIVIGRTATTIGEAGSGSLFSLDLVPSTRPMIYLVQEGMPRIVIFGDDTRVLRPAIASMWSDRFLLSSLEEDAEKRTVEIAYRDHRSGKLTRRAVPDDLARLARFLGHQTTPEEPEPGLGLSFSEVVGILYGLTKQDAVGASFATERDRLMARLLDAATLGGADRPVSEGSRAREEQLRARMLSEGRAAVEASQRPTQPPTRDPSRLLVPIAQPPGTSGTAPASTAPGGPDQGGTKPPPEPRAPRAP
jgi:flagellar basal body P-ring protein FlgI